MVKRLTLEALVVTLAAVALSAPAWFAPPRWTPDSVVYEARALELTGVPSADARREAIAIGHGVVHLNGRRLTTNEVAQDEHWYRRRVLLPAAAALLQPVTGSRGLLDVAIGAYILLAPALFLLLRLRFARVPAAIATVAVMAFPPLTNYALRPLSDGAGLLAVLIALLAMVMTVERSRWWLGLWVAAIAVGSVTRESIAVPVLVAAVLTIRRVRNASWLLLTGLAAIAPAMLFIKISYWRQLSLVTAGDFGRPVTERFGPVLHSWLSAVAHLPLWDYEQQPLWTLLLAAALFAFVCQRESTAPRLVISATLIGSLLYLASLPNPTFLRLEFVLLPVAAYAVARSCEWLPLHPTRLRRRFTTGSGGHAVPSRPDTAHVRSTLPSSTDP
jgi:hypothetical protein